jgi:hypothetical protein
MLGRFFTNENEDYFMIEQSGIIYVYKMERYNCICKKQIKTNNKKVTGFCIGGKPNYTYVLCSYLGIPSMYKYSFTDESIEANSSRLKTEIIELPYKEAIVKKSLNGGENRNQVLLRVRTGEDNHSVHLIYDINKKAEIGKLLLSSGEKCDFEYYNKNKCLQITTESRMAGRYTDDMEDMINYKIILYNKGEICYGMENNLSNTDIRKKLLAYGAEFESGECFTEICYNTKLPLYNLGDEFSNHSISSYGTYMVSSMKIASIYYILISTIDGCVEYVFNAPDTFNDNECVLLYNEKACILYWFNEINTEIHSYRIHSSKMNIRKLNDCYSDFIKHKQVSQNEILASFFETVYASHLEEVLYKKMSEVF